MTNHDDTGVHGAQRARLIVAASVVALLVAGLAILQVRTPAETPAATRATSTATPTPTSSPTPSPTPEPGPCDNQASGPITPTQISFPGAAGDAKVIALPRDGRDIPSEPPLTKAGKSQVAWDRPPGIKPGSAKGNVLLNAHRWPDGSALGDKLFSDLKEGDRIILRGDDASVCYEVDKEVEVLASRRYPAFYDREGPPQVALIVCSGKRLGPGNWTHRTIWFAKQV